MKKFLAILSLSITIVLGQPPRSENPNLGDKTFSFGLTYYLNNSQSFLNSNLPVNLSIGARYGTKNYTNDALNLLNQIT